MILRPIGRNDVSALQAVIDATKLFPADMLPGMVGDFLADTTKAEIWFTCEIDGDPISLAYAIPERMTDGTWSLLAIAVLPSQQGHGVGSAMVEHLEALLQERDQRLLIVETSGTSAFRRTRQFYRKIGYTEEARIRDFYAPGDDKIVFWKSLP